MHVALEAQQTDGTVNLAIGFGRNRHGSVVRLAGRGVLSPDGTDALVP